jgi:hypothetical protein
LGVGDYFYATLIDTSNNLEIVKVTGRAINTMTVVRGQDSTIARVYALGSRLELRPVAAVFNEKADVTYVDAQDAILDAGKLDHVAPGAAGNVLTSTGLDWVSQTPAIGYTGFSTVYFTASGIWTPPTGITKARVSVVGAGGGGYVINFGGGRGGYAKAFVTGISGPVNITVGVGGIGGGSPTSGGQSSFGTFVTTTGGGVGVQGVGVGSNGTGSVPNGVTLRTGESGSHFADIIGATNNTATTATPWTPSNLVKPGAGGAVNCAGANGIVIIEF